VIYLLTAIGLSPDGSSTVHIYTQTIHRAQNKQYKEQYNNWESVGRAPSWLVIQYDKHNCSSAYVKIRV